MATRSLRRAFYVWPTPWPTRWRPIRCRNSQAVTGRSTSCNASVLRSSDCLLAARQPRKVDVSELTRLFLCARASEQPLVAQIAALVVPRFLHLRIELLAARRRIHLCQFPFSREER